ncbi:hypothetical protein D3C84_834310 [compost metagenome]
MSRRRVQRSCRRCPLAARPAPLARSSPVRFPGRCAARGSRPAPTPAQAVRDGRACRWPTAGSAPAPGSVPAPCSQASALADRPSSVDPVRWQQRPPRNRPTVCRSACRAPPRRHPAQRRSHAGGLRSRPARYGNHGSSLAGRAGRGSRSSRIRAGAPGRRCGTCGHRPRTGPE